MLITLRGRLENGQIWMTDIDEIEDLSFKPIVSTNIRYTAGGKSDIVMKKTKGQKACSLSFTLYSLSEVEQIEKTFQATNSIDMFIDYGDGIVRSETNYKVTGDSSYSVKVNPLRVRYVYTLTLERVVL